MNDNLKRFLDEVEAQAEFDSVAAASACAEDQEKILKLCKIARAFAAVVEEARKRCIPVENELTIAIRAADAALAALGEK